MKSGVGNDGCFGLLNRALSGGESYSRVGVECGCDLLFDFEMIEDTIIDLNY